MEIILRYLHFFLTIFGFPLIIIFIVMGIIKLATARGDKNKKKSGRQILIWAIAIFGVYILVDILSRYFNPWNFLFR